MRRRKRQSKPKRLPNRRGTLTVWAVVAMTACLCCVGVALNHGILSNRRSECRQSARAAATAAARNLLTDALLHADSQPFEIEATQLRAKTAAVEISRSYSHQTGVPSLSPENVSIGSRVFNPATNRLQLLENTMRPNVVIVTIANSPGEPSGRLSLNGLTGVTHARIAAAATAILENHVVGFRAFPECAIPLVPLAIPETSTEEHGNSWANNIESNHGNDSWSWNTADLQVTRAADRLPEITVSLHSSMSPAALRSAEIISLSSPETRVEDTVRQISLGVTMPDLSYSKTEKLVFPRPATIVPLSDADLDRIENRLESIVGQRRIFPLINAGDGSHSMSSKLTRVVAARVLVVRRHSLQLDITLQPCVISTATALMAPANAKVPQNPYIWKILLAE